MSSNIIFQTRSLDTNLKQKPILKLYYWNSINNNIIIQAKTNFAAMQNKPLNHSGRLWLNKKYKNNIEMPFSYCKITLYSRAFLYQILELGIVEVELHAELTTIEILFAITVIKRCYIKMWFAQDLRHQFYN